MEIHIFIYIYKLPSRFSIWIFYISSTWDYTTFHFFFNVENVFQKFAGLWLDGEVANHVGLYGFKVAEGYSAFQR